MRIGVVFLLLLFGLVASASSVWAHDAEPISRDMELGITYYVDHSDQDDWKGTMELTIRNTGDIAWGDFHFLLPDGGPVIFGEDTDVPAITSLADDLWDVDFSLYQLDFTFYDAPVGNDDSITFLIYTDNTQNNLPLFSVAMEASPVPIPAAAWLMCSGLIGAVGVCRRKR